MYSTNTIMDFTASVRRPIQCEGIDRGFKRMAEVATAGAVNPQINWGSLLGGVAQALPSILSMF